MMPVPEEPKLSTILAKTVAISKPTELSEGSDPTNLPIFAVIACLRNNVDRVVGLCWTKSL